MVHLYSPCLAYGRIIIVGIFFPFLREGGTSSIYLWTRFVIFRFVDLLEFVRLEIIFFFLLQAFVLASDAHFM